MDDIFAAIEGFFKKIFDIIAGIFKVFEDAGADDEAAAE